MKAIEIRKIVKSQWIRNSSSIHMKQKSIAGFDIESFNVSHDAIDPQFYIFNNNYKKFTMLTDTGYVSDRMKGMIRGSDAFMFESNHDVDMLRMCRYPWKTKQRIQ